MKKFLLFVLFFLGFIFNGDLYGQSSPQVLKPGITINRITTIEDGAIRIGLDPITHKIYYILTDGNIYQVIQPTIGAAYDTLIYSTAQHGVEYVQGMTFHDSTLYLAGNNHTTTPITNGIVVRGKLQSNGNRKWDTLLYTSGYQTADYFDHLFTGLAVNASGDSIYLCSGARGDHGEIQNRYGAYPGLRNVPITTLILALPTKQNNTILLQNDSASLAASGYIFCRGIRSTFDMAFDSYGNLFGVENSGDYDHNEEMNLLQRGHHYGFPWRMGDTDNPQQFPSFNPATDPLINHYARAWRRGFWNNDLTFPPRPPSITFDDPIKNYGPDCDKYRDSTGAVNDASDNGIPLATFSSHRSPLGFVFDNSHVLASPYNGDAFMLSWTKGYDSCGCTLFPDSSAGTFVDPSQDLVHLDLSFDSVAGKFRLNATRIIGDFQHPVDADIDSNKIYVIENGYGGTSGLYEIILPGIIPPLPCHPAVNVNVPDVCNPNNNSVSISSFGTLPNDYYWYNTIGTLIRADTGISKTDTISSLPQDGYYVIINDSGFCGLDTLTFFIPDSLYFHVDSVRHTSCIGCTDGIIYFTLNGGSPPYNVITTAGLLSGNTIINLPADNYTLCVLDSYACTFCDPVIILDDPTGISPINENTEYVIYPNPVNNSATLRFDGDGKISVRLFDISGNQMKILLNEDAKTGVKELQIDCSQLAMGCYTIEITDGLKRIFRKLVLIK